MAMRGQGQKKNYNLDYSRFDFLDKEEEQEAMLAAAKEQRAKGGSAGKDYLNKNHTTAEADAAAGNIPPFREMLRDMPVELQQAYHLMEVAKRDGDENAQKLASEMALKAVEKGGPEVKEEFMKNIKKMKPEYAKEVSAVTGIPVGGPPVDDDVPVSTENKIDTLREQMEKGQIAAKKQLDELQKQQDSLEQMKSPEDVLKFMTEGGMTEADLQRMFSGDQAHMESCIKGMLDKTDGKEPGQKTSDAEKACKATEVLHGTLCGSMDEAEAEKAIEQISSGGLDSLDDDTPAGTATSSSAKASKAPPKPARAPEPPARVVNIPDYRLQYQKDANGRYTGVELRATLPGVSSMAMILLDVSADHLRLSTLEPAPGYVVNAGPFPVAIDHENAKAKYSKKREELLITVPAVCR